MFAYILKPPPMPRSAETDGFFRRFKTVPGLLHAYNLGEIGKDDQGLVVAIWESREAAERYLNGDPLKKQVDESVPGVTRTMYEVVDSK
jgi:hypothetical protein